MAFIKLAKIRCIYKVLLLIAGCKGTIFSDKTSKIPSYSRASVIFFCSYRTDTPDYQVLNRYKMRFYSGRQKEKAKICRKCNGLQENALILKYLANAEVHKIVFWRI